MIHQKVLVVYNIPKEFWISTKRFSLFEPCCPRQCIQTTYIYWVSIEFATATDHHLPNKNCLSMECQGEKNAASVTKDLKIFLFYQVYMEF